jgi:hypothetical protein
MLVIAYLCTDSEELATDKEYRTVLLNCWAAAQYWALASVILSHKWLSWNLSF